VKGIEVYGATETTTPVWRSLHEPLRRGSCGKPSNEFYEVTIVDPESREELALGDAGEIVVRPRLPWILMQGYLGMPQETVEAWDNYRFNTGDAGRFDEDGYLYFVDRMKDRIRRRAENISSYEIESAACAFPPVREAAAVGVPSGYQSDDDIKLCVVAEQALDVKALLAHLAARLPHYMVPRYIDILPALPRSATNKVRKQVLREQNITSATWDRHAAGISLRDLMADIESRNV
ncbi:MAG: AMP-binding enzyme, partial [Sciscionella sp.]